MRRRPVGSSVRRFFRESLLQHSPHLLNRRWIQGLLGYQGSEAGVNDDLGPFPVTYDLSSEIGRALFTKGTFEEPEIRFFERLLVEIEDPVVFDIGANIGLHSLRWARRQPAATIWAFEPSHDSLSLLRRNVANNGLTDRITIVDSAVADSIGTRTFFATSDNAYGSLRDTHRKSVVDTYEVAATTVDAFVEGQGIERIDLIKIDVEGLEREVVRGARSTLLRQHPHLFVEIYGGTHSNRDPEGTVSDVMALGYAAWVLREGTPEPYVRHRDELYNYWFEPIEGPVKGASADA